MYIKKIKNMSFFEDKISNNSLIYNFDNTFDNNLILEKLFNSSYNSYTNTFDQQKMNNYLNQCYKENQNNVNTFGEKRFISPSGLNNKKPIKDINDELNGQFFEESTTKSLQEIGIKNDAFKSLDSFNSSFKNERKKQSKNKEEKSTMITKENLTDKNKNKRGKNINNLSSNINVMKYLSEKALNYYLKKGQGQDVDEFFANYLKNKNDKKKSLLKKILSSNEFNSKIQKYRKQKYSTSFFSNNENFLQKKHYLKRDDYNIIEKNLNIFNNLKNLALIKDKLKKKQLLSQKNQKDKLNNLFQNNKVDNNIKIKNNLIIDLKEEKAYIYKSITSNTQKDINYEKIFMDQFINKYLDKN